MGCTLAQPGEYDWTVHVRRRCGLFVKLFWPLVAYDEQNDACYIRRLRTLLPRACHTQWVMLCCYRDTAKASDEHVWSIRVVSIIHCVVKSFDRSACFTTNSKEIEVQCKLECGRCPTWWPPCRIQEVPSAQCRPLLDCRAVTLPI